MQVLEKIHIALLLVDLAQPRNHQLPVLEVDPLNVLYIHYNKANAARRQGGGSIDQARRCTTVDGR